MHLESWWNSLDALLRVMYLIAIPSSVILLIQLVLTIIGFGSGGAPDGGDASGLDSAGLEMDGLNGDGLIGVEAADIGFAPVDADSSMVDSVLQAADPGALRLFSMGSVISFLTVFGWSSIVLYQGGMSGALSVIIGFLLGAAAMFGVAKLIRATVRLAESGNMQLKNAVRQTASVYVPIPAAGGGEGKVTLTLQGRFVDLSAVTDGGAIPTGALVEVTGVRGDALVVKRMSVPHSDSRDSTTAIGG